MILIYVLPSHAKERPGMPRTLQQSWMGEIARKTGPSCSEQTLLWQPDLKNHEQSTV